jgi:integrase
MEQETAHAITRHVRIADIGKVADQVRADHEFQNYRQRLRPNTKRGQDADIDLFITYLQNAGTTEIGDLKDDVYAWQGMTAGLISGFNEWQLVQGYALASINRRLATLKRYARLALRAQVIPSEDFVLIQDIEGFRHRDRRTVDSEREKTRISTKKPVAVALTAQQIRDLKHQPDTLQGKRDRLLMCLLLDHGLRCGEITDLRVEYFKVTKGLLTFDREKVDEEQTHELTQDTLLALLDYTQSLSLTEGPLWIATRKGGNVVHGTMSRRAINKRVLALGRKINIPNLSPHDCRHAWATRMANGRTGLHAMKSAGGWKSTEMPMRYQNKAAIANEHVILADE